MTGDISYLYGKSALTRGRTIGLYGGSFNPAHDGHLYIAREALKRLRLDEIWFLVSPQNPLKASDDMAPFHHRFESAARLTAQNPRIHVIDIEQKIGSQFTAITVGTLQKALPQTQFVWIMGADNMASFNKWQHWRLIAEMLPIAIFDRSGYAIEGCHSEFARTFAKHRVTATDLKYAHAPAWTFVTLPRHPGSATTIRNQQGNNWYTDA